MLSITARADARSAASYYLHLTRGDAAPKIEDYYATEGAGRYVGRGAEALGLAGEVHAEEFEELAAGRTPLGEARNAGDDNRRAGWDLTFSAPKSVSVIWGTADERARMEIERAHDAAVAEAFAFIEDHAGFTRRGSGERFRDEERREHVGLVGAVYRHGTSRELDPQLHSHVMLFNVAPRGDGTTGAIDPKPLYQWKMAGGAVYRAAFAERLQALGYGIEADLEKRSFRVAAVPRELEAAFSTRRRQIQAALEERGATGARASEVAALDTRRTKRDASRETLLAAWQERAQEIAPGFSPGVARTGLTQRTPAPLDVRHIQAEMTRQLSTVSEAQLYAVVAQARQLEGGRAAVEHAIEIVRSDGGTITLSARGQTRYTTCEMQDIERAMVDYAAQLSERHGHPVAAEAIAAAENTRALSEEQRAAVRHVFEAGDIAAVQGRAGTGKGYLLGAVREALETEGYRVRGVSLSGKAAQELQNGSGIESTTLKRFEMDSRGWTDEQGQKHEPADRLTARDVLVVDEAGMIGSRQTEALLKDAQGAGAKVVLVGDTRQLQAIEAGAAFRAIQERIGCATLDDIRRQHSHEDRQAVRDLAAGRADVALGNLNRRDRLHETDSAREAKQRVGRAVADDLATGKRSLGLTGTRSEARDVNDAARVRARERGLVQGEDLPVSTTHGNREFAAGDRILFTRNDRQLEVKNGDLATIKTIAENGAGGVRISAELDRGGIRTVNADLYQHIDHGYAVTVHKAQGSTVDKAHVLAADNAMSSREWAYVAGSRARDETHIYADRDTLAELAPAWSRARQKDVTLDYQPREAQRQRQEQLCISEHAYGMLR